MDRIRIGIVDDHTLMRSGLKHMMAYQEDIEVVGEAADGVEALEMIARTNPDIVLLDVSMPRMGGLECLKIISGQYPKTRVIMLTMYEDSQYIKEGFAVGARGYVLKRAADEVLYEAVRKVYAGELFLHSDAGKLLVTALYQKETSNSVPIKPLSEKEKQVLKLLALGNSNMEIADALRISVKTVETYKYRIMEKLNAKKRAELVKYALDNGFITETRF